MPQIEQNVVFYQCQILHLNFCCKFGSKDFVNGTKWNCVKLAGSEKYKNFADFFCQNLFQYPGWKKADVVTFLMTRYSNTTFFFWKN